MLKKSPIMIIGLVVAAFSSAAEEESVSMLFEKAVYAEETVGDLDAAIKIYEEIIEKEESNRTYAAQAHYRLGMCYLKKGKNEEAAKVLNALIDLYPDQSELVKRTKDKLTDLNKYKADPIIRRVFAGISLDAPVTGGDLSRNGRIFVYGDIYKECDLCILDLASGEKHYITDNTVFQIISSDGKEIAYQWVKDKIFELRTIQRDGSNRKVLIHKNRDNDDPEPVEWSPDCSNILVYQKSKSFTGFALISTNDGSIRNLNPLNDGFSKWRMNVSFSPDGRYLAFNDSRKSLPDLNNDLYIVDVATGQETPLSKHPADDILVGWSPDGDKILFTSDRTPKRSLWALELRDGLPHGNPVMLHNQFDGNIPYQVNEKGTIFYTLSSSIENVYLTELNETGDSIDGSSSNASVNYINSCWKADWSPDGKQLAFLAKDVLDKIVIVIQLLETGEERILEFERLNNAITRGDGVRWSPDQENLLFVTYFPKEGGSLFTINAKTGDVTQLLNTNQLSVNQLEHNFLFNPLWEPERNYIYLKQGLRRILRYNLETKQVERIYASKNSQYSLALSSDGKWLAFFESNQDDNGQQIYSLQVISTQDRKEMHEILRLSENEYRTNGIINNSNSIVNWTPDGKYLLYKKNSGNDELDVGIWRVNVETGDQDLVADLSDFVNLKDDEHIVSLRLHPDGRRIAYSTVLSTFDIWAMENVLDR